MSKLTLICSDWRPVEKSTLLGFARIHIGELDLTIHDVAVHEKADRRWAALPARPWIKGGAVVTGDAGKIQYSTAPRIRPTRGARRVLERRHPRRQRALPGRPGARRGSGDMIEANEARRRLLAGGYSPLPLIGKRPVFDDWQKRIDVTEHEIEYWSRSAPAAANTGILTKFVPTLDIDLLDTTAAVAVEQLARERFEEQGPVLARTGAPPRRAVPFRTDAPFAKITVDLIAPDGSTGPKARVLGRWPAGRGPTAFIRTPASHIFGTGGAPGQIKRAGPCLTSTQCEAQALIDDAAGLLVAQFGYRLAKAKARKAANGAGEDELAGWAIDFGDHDALVALAMKLLRTGMRDGAVVNFLRAQVEGLTGVEEDRKARRLKEIPAMVASARAKFDSEAAPAEPSPNGGKAAPSLLIWYGADPPPPPKYLVSNMLPETGGAHRRRVLARQDLRRRRPLRRRDDGRRVAGEPVMRSGAILRFVAEGEKEIEGRVRAAVENKFGGSGPEPFARQAGGVPLLTDPHALENSKPMRRRLQETLQGVRPPARAHRYRHRLGSGRVYR